MKLKTKTKFLLVFAVIFIAFLLFNTNTVKAETFKYDYDYGNDIKGTMTITSNDKKLTITDSGDNTILELENFERVIGVDNGALIMKQVDINKFINDRDIPYTIKKKVTNDVTSAKTESGETIEIQTIDNEKWLVYSGKIHYEARNERSSPAILGYKNNDISDVSWDEEIDYYINNIDKLDLENRLSIYFDVKTEVMVNQDIYIETCFTNKRDIEYERIGGGGSNINGYIMLNPIYSEDASKYPLMPKCFIPTTADLSEVYLKIYVANYQGEKIDLKNDKGTLYYEGKEQGYERQVYVYKNKLSNLKIKENEIGLINYKLTNGYEINNYLRGYYILDENAKETTVQVGEDTKNNYNIRDEIEISYFGSANFDSVEIERNDSIYDDVKGELDENSINYFNGLYIDILDIYRVSGDYGGNLTITFNVGEQYNGKYYYITHRIHYGEWESFEGIVENGKITIVVDSLSPFGISIYDGKKDQQPTNPPKNKGEKDDTPKTGSIDIIGYVSIATLVSMAGIIVLKKKIK